MIIEPDYLFKKIITIKNKPIYLITILHILYSKGYSWPGKQYIPGTKDLWYPAHVQTPYIRIAIYPASKRFIYSGILHNEDNEIEYNTLFKLL